MSVAVRVPVVESSQPGEARRVAVGMAQRLGFDETTAGKVAIVVTEGATNLVKHGGAARYCSIGWKRAAKLDSRCSPSTGERESRT